MRYYSSLFLLLTATFAVGVLVGDNYAPISGATTRALTIKCATLEVQVAELGVRVMALETESEALRPRIKAMLPNVDL